MGAARRASRWEWRSPSEGTCLYSMCEDTSEAFCEWRAGTSGEDWQEVSSSILFSHILSSRVAVVFSVLTCSPTYCKDPTRREHSVHVFHPHTVIMRDVVFSVPILFTHAVTANVSIVFRALVLLTHILSVTRERGEQCSVLCVLNRSSHEAPPSQCPTLPI